MGQLELVLLRLVLLQRVLPLCQPQARQQAVDQDLPPCFLVGPWLLPLASFLQPNFLVSPFILFLPSPPLSLPSSRLQPVQVCSALPFPCL
jgi:hypothetical protein